MLALRLHGPADLRLHEEADPLPDAGEEVVRVTGVGLCGSDLHWYEEGGIGDTRLERPLVLGHEVGGVVASGPRAGVRVALDPADPCERCPQCLAGNGNLCTSMRFLGHGRTDGGLRTIMAWPSRLLAPVPAEIADVEVPLLETLGVALHAAELGHVRAGMSAAVCGCGPIGLLLVSVLRALGVGPILVTERLVHRAEAALARGAADARLAGPDGTVPDAEAWVSVDVCFEAAGDDGALETCFRLVRPGGRVVLVGIPGDDRVAFGAALPRRKGLDVVFSRRMKAHHLRRAIELVRVGRVELGSLVSATYPLADGVAAFEALRARAGLKLVVEPSPSPQPA